MPVAFDARAVEEAAESLSLALPRAPQRGRVGEVRASSVGSSLELLDFRPYHPGDDVRHVDWNAVARTGELIVRVRHDEVSPRVELIVDASGSMGLTPAKAARTVELSLLFAALASVQGLSPVVFVLGKRALWMAAELFRASVSQLELDGRLPLPALLDAAPPLRPCGIRIVVSDFLFDVPLEPLMNRLSHGASRLWLVQVMDDAELDPPGGFGARLVDAETGEALDRVLAPAVLDHYLARLTRHQELLRAAAARVRAQCLLARASEGLSSLVRGPLAPLFSGERGR